MNFMRYVVCAPWLAEIGGARSVVAVRYAAAADGQRVKEFACC